MSRARFAAIALALTLGFAAPAFADVTAFIGTNTITGYYGFDNRQESDYVDFSLARWEKSGRMWDEFMNWADAKTYATTAGQQDEAYWKSSLGARRANKAAG